MQRRKTATFHKKASFYIFNTVILPCYIVSINRRSSRRLNKRSHFCGSTNIKDQAVALHTERKNAIRQRWTQISHNKDTHLKNINSRYKRKTGTKKLRPSKRKNHTKEENFLDTVADNICKDIDINDKLQSASKDIQDVLYKKRNDGNYTCDICQTIFEQKSKILRHILSKHSFHRPFKCNACGKSFKYKCDLKAHRLIHQEVDSSLLHSCDKCDYRTKTKNNLKSHYIRKHTDDYKFACEHCGKRFKMEWDLKFHIGTHGSSQHMCDICGKFYTSDYSLYKHRKVAHLNEYKFQCDVCNKRLLTQENLDNHMRQHDKTYECKECGKVFASKRYLATHMTTHTGIKPYVCQICKKNFRTSHMRNTHLLTHSADRPHICDLCGQAFKRRYYMIEHRRKHPDSHLSSPPMPFGKNSNFESKSNSVNYGENFVTEIPETDKLGQLAEKKNSLFLLDCGSPANKLEYSSIVLDHGRKEEIHLELSVRREMEESFGTQGNAKINYHNCDHCGMKFPLKTMLNRHRLSHNLKHTTVRIKHLKEKYGYLKHSDLRRYRKSMLGQIGKREYACTLCNFTCGRSINLNVHLQRKHRINEVKPVLKNVMRGHKCSKETNSNRRMSTRKSTNVFYFCDVCDFECKKSDALDAHVARCHRKSEKRVQNSSSRSNKWNCRVTKTEEKKFENEVPQSTPMFSCSSCTFRCKKRSTMTSHVAKKHNNKTNMEERCDLCDFKCTKKSTLYSHKRQHKIEALNEVYACNECDFKTIKRTSLYSHIKRKHKTTRSCTGEDQPELFYCSQCDYKNKNKYELKVHVARKHTDDFKFSCETCGKKFKVKGDLTNHIRFSHREQPVICDVCGKTCLNSNSLYVHQKFAHYKAKYECQVCKRRMVSQENLNEHMIRQHERKENVVCEECGKTFSRNSRLKVHMRIHTGDKPYSCTICSKAFARRTALKQHLLIHTGMRPYVCDICGKAFTQKPGLISHRKSHPGSHPPLPRVLIDHILNDVMNN